jgi:hypothetical protein
MQNACGRGELHFAFLLERLKVEDHFGDLAVDGRIILKQILNE